MVFNPLTVSCSIATPRPKQGALNLTRVWKLGFQCNLQCYFLKALKCVVYSSVELFFEAVF